MFLMPYNTDVCINRTTTEVVLDIRKSLQIYVNILCASSYFLSQSLDKYGFLANFVRIIHTSYLIWMYGYSVDTHISLCLHTGINHGKSDFSQNLLKMSIFCQMGKLLSQFNKIISENPMIFPSACMFMY